MATLIPAQPTTAAAADQRELTFTDRVKFLVQLNRALIYMISEVSKLPKGGRYQFTSPVNGQPIEIGRVELKKYSSALNTKFEHLGKDHNLSKRKKARKPKLNADGTTGVTNKLAQPAFISDQLKNFFIEMLGTGPLEYTRYQDATVTNKNGREVVKRIPAIDGNGNGIGGSFSAQDLSILGTSNISVAAVNTELFTLCTYMYKSKSQANGTRFHVTDLMNKYFGTNPATGIATNCHWFINGQELPYNSATAGASDEQLLAYGIPREKMAKFRADIADLDKSALDRIAARNSELMYTAEGQPILGANGQQQVSYPIKKNGTQYIPYIRDAQEAAQIHASYPNLSAGGDDHGIVFAMFMVLATYFRIPTYAMTTFTDVNVLSSPENVSALNNLQSQLKDIIQTFRDSNGGVKKAKAKPKQARKPRQDLLTAYGMTSAPVAATV
jgi:hypothetical protein